MGRGNRELGFSMIESTVVAMLALVFLTISALNVRQALAREEIDGWVREIVYDLKAGQQAAVTRRTSVAASFQDQTYTIAVVGGGTLRQQTLPAHITFGPTLRLVTFDRRGTPAGATTLTADSARAGSTYTITVDAATGRVSYSGP